MNIKTLKGSVVDDEGKIINAKTIISLQWLALHHQDVRRAWCTD